MVRGLWRLAGWRGCSRRLDQGVSSLNYKVFVSEPQLSTISDTYSKYWVASEGTSITWQKLEEFDQKLEDHKKTIKWSQVAVLIKKIISK